MHADTFTVITSIAALLLASYSLWITNLRKGELRLTRPAQFFFGPDCDRKAKVFFRGLLWTTGAQGHTIEHMHLKLRRGSATQTFPIWVYGEKANLTLGSGLRVLPAGLTFNHHFLQHHAGSGFRFDDGLYVVEIWASTADSKKARCLWRTELRVTTEQARAIYEGAGLYFDWNPDTNTYVSHLDSRRDDPSAAEIAKMVEALTARTN